MKKIIVLNAIVAAFILLFVYAALSKMMAVDQFQLQLSQSPLLFRYAGLAAWVVPIIELIIVSLLLFPRTRLAGLLGSFGLMVSFTAYIIVVTQYSEYVPCSCGGILQGMSWAQHLLFNTGFILLSLLGIFIYPVFSFDHVIYCRNKQGHRKPEIE